MTNQMIHQKLEFVYEVVTEIAVTVTEFTGDAHFGTRSNPIAIEDNQDRETYMGFAC